MQNVYLVNNLYPKYVNNSLNSTIRKNPILKWPKDLNRYLTKEDMKMENKQVKRCSVPGLGFTHWWVTPSPGSPGLHSLARASITLRAPWDPAVKFFMTNPAQEFSATQGLSNQST